MNKNNLTLKNIHAYLQGNLRYLAEQYGPEFIKAEPHIREQIMFRIDISNPKCIESKSCVECGCTVPNLMYADKQCGGECYPEMMNKEQWEDFKLSLRIYTLENKIDKVSYPFDWRAITAMMTYKEELEEKKKIVKPDSSYIIKGETIEIKNVKKPNPINHTFTIVNNNDITLFIKDVSTSCGCTSLSNITNQILLPNGSLEIPVQVNTTNKAKGDHVFTVTLLMSNETKTKLTIKANII